MMAGITRRSIARLTAGAAAVSFAGTACAGTPHPDAEVLRLCAEWHTAKAAGDALYTQVKSLEDELRMEGEIDAATDWLVGVERGLEALPARTLEGVKAKASVVRRLGNSDRMAHAVICDLLALGDVA